jgi:site-specific recombinase XerD
MAPREKRLRFGRIHRFEAFLAGRAEAPGPSAPKRAALRVFALRYRPLERPLDVRDAAFLAAVAVTGSAEAARALTLADVREGGGLLRIADRPAEGAAAEALRRWLGLRRRMLRPEQARLFRRGQRWAQSPLLFPAPDGKPLSRSAFANALRRFKRQAGEGARDA